MVRTGRAVRQQQIDGAKPACPSCGHFEAHRERPSQAEGYVPLMFHCSATGCACVIDRRGD